ncbi:hypothetical protein, partial [Klebsiella variicola]|uniref:hypothetical protein n=1 Tax=Klebsiella variicola TaxID=244366 RepID=UPI001C481F3D
ITISPVGSCLMPLSGNLSLPKTLNFARFKARKPTIYLILIGYLIPSCHFPQFHFLAQGDFF